MFNPKKMMSVARVMDYFRDLLNYYIDGAKESVRKFGRGVLVLVLATEITRAAFHRNCQNAPQNLYCVVEGCGAGSVSK